MGTDEKIKTEDTLMHLLAEKFRLMNIRSNIRSKIHFCIATGDHEGTSNNAKGLKEVESRLDYLTKRIEEISLDETPRKLQAL